jgi:hypothetical protein
VIQELDFQCGVGVLMRQRNDDVLHLCGILVVELREIWQNFVLSLLDAHERELE